MKRTVAITPKMISAVGVPAPNARQLSGILDGWDAGLEQLKDQSLAEGYRCRIDGIRSHLKQDNLREARRQYGELKPIIEATLSHSSYARQSRKKVWAIRLAETLAAEHARFRNAWDAIPGSGTECFIAEHEVYRDGDMLCATHDKTGRTDELARESFRTGYFSPARKRLL